MLDFSMKRRMLCGKFLIGFLCLLAIPIMYVVYSLNKGSGWGVLIHGIPVYLTLFGAAIYQLIKELRALRREEEESKASLNPDDR